MAADRPTDDARAGESAFDPARAPKTHPTERARAFIIHPDVGLTQDDRAAAAALRPAWARLDEAVGLAAALGVEIVGSELIALSSPKAGALFGSGKIAELRGVFDEKNVDLVVVDGPLTPVQQRNLETAWHVKVLDRTGLILEIFGARAQTREGVLQVDLAHLEYQKSRLVRSWTHLERQRGGVGFMGGPGETQIEADRRMIGERIIALRRRLEKVAKTRGQHRQRRQRAPQPVIAFVGYTNAGKSTLFNRLTRASVLAKDMLFATLDPTMRAIRLPHGRSVILSDTVGFISDLPTELVAAFRATLEEVISADVIVHVRDMADPTTGAQKADVMSVLAALGLGEEALGRVIEARNKIDLLHGQDRNSLIAETAREENAVCVSAATGEGVDALLALVEKALAGEAEEFDFDLGAREGAALAWLYNAGCVIGRSDEDGRVRLRLRMAPLEAGRFQKRFGLTLPLAPAAQDDDASLAAE